MKRFSILILISMLFVIFFPLEGRAASGQESVPENESESSVSVDRLLNAVKSESGGKVVYHLCADFDGDGTQEMFALVQKDSSDTVWDEESDVMGGRLWYANTKGTYEIMSQPRPYYKDPQILTFDGKSVLPLNQAFATGTRTYLWGVLGGYPYELNASGRINGLSVNEYEEIEGIGEAYNGNWSKESNVLTGHTWNTYYFYYDHGNIREYGGLDITWEDFCRIPGIEEARKLIEDRKLGQGEEIESILYRNNGIVVVNFEKDEEFSISYSHLQLRIGRGVVQICKSQDESGFGDGTIAGAFLNDLATFPDRFPF